MMNRNRSAVREMQNERSEWVCIVKRADLVYCHDARKLARLATLRPGRQNARSLNGERSRSGARRACDSGMQPERQPALPGALGSAWGESTTLRISLQIGDACHRQQGKNVR